MLHYKPCQYDVGVSIFHMDHFSVFLSEKKEETCLVKFSSVLQESQDIRPSTAQNKVQNLSGFGVNFES